MDYVCKSQGLKNSSFNWISEFSKPPRRIIENFITCEILIGGHFMQIIGCSSKRRPVSEYGKSIC